MSDQRLVHPTHQLPQTDPPAMTPGTYYIQTWGCQMNEEDSEQIGLYLQNAGFVPAQSIMEAQIILLNTCSVRKKPEDKAFSLLGELVLYKTISKERVIGVCGCMAQIRAKEIKQRAPHVDFVVGTANISEIPVMVQEALEERQFNTRLDLPERKGAIVTDLPQRKVDRKSKIKAFVPIQYGCDKFCTFCIVPATRGRERSRPTEDILDEVRKLVDQGTREITLLGQTVNSYGKNLAEGRVPFSQLLWKLNEIDGLERIRFTSPYPTDFKQDLIETIRDCPKVMEHVHLPLQSGDNDVLESMKRLYTMELFEEIVSNLRTSIPQIAITTDIIVGFPGETDAQFEKTMDVIRKMRFDGAFMFVYSPRPNTAAEGQEQVPFAVKKSRIHELVAVQTEITCERNQETVGRELEVLVEGPSPKTKTQFQGYSREFKMMHFPASTDMVGKLVRVKAEHAHLWGLSGTLI